MLNIFLISSFQHVSANELCSISSCPFQCAKKIAGEQYKWTYKGIHVLRRLGVGESIEYGAVLDEKNGDHVWAMHRLVNSVAHSLMTKKRRESIDRVLKFSLRWYSKNKDRCADRPGDAWRKALQEKTDAFYELMRKYANKQHQEGGNLNLEETIKQLNRPKTVFPLKGKRDSVAVESTVKAVKELCRGDGDALNVDSFEDKLKAQFKLENDFGHLEDEDIWTFKYNEANEDKEFGFATQRLVDLEGC